MATPNSPRPAYYTPNQPSNHQRRGSSRRSFTSLSGPQLDSPRSPCPRDGDAFSYNPAHLPAWYIPQHLWDRLPLDVKTALAATQHAGAAVLTGFERLDKYNEQTTQGLAFNKPQHDDFFAQLMTLPPPKIRTISNASSVSVSDVASPVFTDTPISESGSPSVASSHGTSAVSPICLSPAETPLVEAKRDRSRERSFSTPMEPEDARYVTELSHLRTEANPRLHHSGLRVDVAWNEAKRTTSIPATDVPAFEEWWAEKKRVISTLRERGKSLSNAINLSPNGMGWTAP